jgi:hypothetical protein
MIYHLLAPFPFAVLCDAEILKQLCLRLVDMTLFTLGDVPLHGERGDSFIRWQYC